MGKGEGEGRGGGEGQGEAGEEQRIAVPALPMPAAVVCCVLNFLIPGLGTFVAGLLNLCFGKKDGMNKATLWAGCCASLGIAFLQLALTLFFFVGWIWSCVWGVAFVGWSAHYYHGTGTQDVNRTHPQGTQVQVAVITRGPQLQGIFAPQNSAVVVAPGPSPYEGPDRYGNPPPPPTYTEAVQAWPGDDKQHPPPAYTA